MNIRSSKIWINGKMIPFDEAKVHILTHALHYGLGVFEGIRYYQTARGCPAIFRLPEHLRRLYDSARVCLMEIPYSKEELIKAHHEVVRANGFADGYIRPLAFTDMKNMGIHGMENPISVAIATYEWGAYLGEDGIKNGVRAKVSTFTRHHVNVSMTKAKITGQYVNSILAKREAKMQGYDEAVLLDPEGYVSECTGENIFIVRDGILKTTAPTSILCGITRDSLIKIARDNKIEIREQRFSRDEIYMADECFCCGTAAEVTPIRSLDDRIIGDGKPGPVTKLLQSTYFDAVRGKRKEYDAWLTYVEK